MFGVGSSTLREAREAGKEAANKAVKMAGGTPKFALVFSSFKRYGNPSVLLEGAKEVLGEIPVMGSTTAGEFTQEGPATGSVVMFVSSSDDITLGVGVGEGALVNPHASGKKAASMAIDRIPMKFKRMTIASDDLSYTPYTAIVIPTQGVEEDILNGIKDVVGGPFTPIIGGTTGADHLPEKGYQIANWRTYRDSTVVGILASRYKTGIGLKHAYKPTDKCGVVTKIGRRVILEIDGKEALRVYTKWTGIPAEEVDVAVQGFDYPIATPSLTGEYYLVRHPEEGPDNALEVGTNVPLGASIVMMEGTIEDQLTSAREAAKLAKEAAGGKPLAAIMFNCAGRRKHLGDEGMKKMIQVLNEELENIPYIGWNTYGEQAPVTRYESAKHNNLTLAILVISNKKVG